MTTPNSDPMVGRTIGHYDILARVGGGGMGVVYQARDSKLGRTVALKFLPQQWSHDEGARQRFLREAQAASATNHPNICTIHDVGATDDGQLFIVMAYYEGQTLKRRLEAGPLPIDEALDIATQVADGLARAHAQGVVHRDVKPGNLMLTEDGVRIVDFGLATFADALKLTTEHSTLGTAAYMSPEQVRGQATDARTDVWAVGVVLYEMLAGHPPFRGSHTEAITFAVRNEAPEPLRAGRPEVPEDVEQLVFRALHKEPAVRFPTGRELARALRQVRGMSVPLDLRTAPVPAPARTIRRAPRFRGWRSRAAVSLLVVALAAWMASPGARVPVAVVPLANLTGDTDLDPYRLALTQTLIEALNASEQVRPVGYARMLEPLRRFIEGDGDVSSREAIRAVAAATDVRVAIVPTLLFEDRAWRARVEFLDVATMTNIAQYETLPTVSMLGKDTAWRLVNGLVPVVEGQFTSRLRHLRDRALAVVGFGPRPRAAGPERLDAARALEEGTRFYDRLEFAAARRAFAAAAELDPGNPWPAAWESRAAANMRQDAGAADAAERARRRLTPQTPRTVARFVEAVESEVRQDFRRAEAGYRALAESDPNDLVWAAELASFLERRNRFADAATVYHAMMRADEGAARPHLELCRLYSPARLNEVTNALERGQRALALYRELGSRPGEAQAQLCLVDTLRVGAEADREAAGRHALGALAIMEDAWSGYQRARAHYYVALAAGATGDMPGARAQFERSLELARASGNADLEPLVLMNLGVAHVALGDTAAAADFYQQSVERYRALRNEARAAQILANRGAMLIERGPAPEDGLRDVQNALKLFQTIGDANFEVFCLQVTAAYYRHTGDHDAAERELNKALTITRVRKLTDDIASLTIDIARSRFALADYEGARERLVDAIGDGSSPRSAEARIWLGRVHTRRGDHAAAEKALALAAADSRVLVERPLRMLLEMARGDLAYERGRPQEARNHFRQVVDAQAASVDELGIEARAVLGLLEGLEGRGTAAAQLLDAALVHAEGIGHVGLASRSRVYAARVAIAAQEYREAITLLAGVAETARLDPETRLQTHTSRQRAFERIGDRSAAEREGDAARALAERLSESLPAGARAGFAARPDIRAALE